MLLGIFHITQLLIDQGNTAMGFRHIRPHLQRLEQLVLRIFQPALLKITDTEAYIGRSRLVLVYLYFTTTAATGAGNQ